MMTIRKGEERGRTRLDWLDGKHSFSFGRYVSREHMGFRSLRVINDDVVAPGGGFGKHPHDAGRAPGGSVPRLTPEWWNRVLLANDPTEGLRAVARRSLARDAKGKRLEPSLWWMEEMVRIKWYHRATRAPCAPRAGASFTAAARQGVG